MEIDLKISNLIDRAAKRFGYERIAPDQLEPLHEEIKARIPPHLQYELSFQYEKVKKKKDWAFFYDEEDGFHYAIGRRDWMPVMVAGFLVGGNPSDGLELLSASISERMWLSVDNPIQRSWMEANREVFQRLEGVDVEELVGDDESDTEFAPEMFTNLSAGVVSMELRTMWRRYQPYKPEFLLGSSHGHKLFRILPVMREASRAPEVAMNQLFDWTADWFEACGFRVNREEWLVNVKGYEPLFAFDSDPGAF